MIELQIEKLSAEEQRVLEVASVTGGSFAANAKALDATVDQEKFENTCEDLSRRQHMVRRTESRPFPDGTISQCYEFVHALYRRSSIAGSQRCDVRGCVWMSEKQLQKLISQHKKRIWFVSAYKHLEAASVVRLRERRRGGDYGVCDY